MKKIKFSELHKFSIGEELNKVTNDIQEKIKLLKEVQAVHPSDFFMFFNESNGKLTYNHLEVFLIDANDNPTVSVKYFNNRYSFFNPIYHTFKNITKWDLEKIEAKREKPKNVGIGKLTLKKLNDWIDYLQFQIDEMEKLNVVNTQVGEDYKKKIAPYNPKYYNHNKGEVTINKVTLEFEICESFVSEKIRVNCGSNFEDFLKLSDNGFKAS